jgi:hypothetical protein
MYLIIIKLKRDKKEEEENLNRRKHRKLLMQNDMVIYIFIAIILYHICIYMYRSCCFQFEEDEEDIISVRIIYELIKYLLSNLMMLIANKTSDSNSFKKIYGG